MIALIIERREKTMVYKRQKPLSLISYKKRVNGIRHMDGSIGISVSHHIGCRYAFKYKIGLIRELPSYAFKLQEYDHDSGIDAIKRARINAYHKYGIKSRIYLANKISNARNRVYESYRE